MIFGDIIKEVVEKLDGAISGVIMGVDGIALEAFAKNGGSFDIQTAGIEYASILKDVQKVAGEMKSGKVSEMSIQSENHIVIIESINPEYFFALAIVPNGNFGKARYLMRTAVPRIVKEL